MSWSEGLLFLSENRKSGRDPRSEEQSGVYEEAMRGQETDCRIFEKREKEDRREDK